MMAQPPGNPTVLKTLKARRLAHLPWPGSGNRSDAGGRLSAVALASRHPTRRSTFRLVSSPRAASSGSAPPAAANPPGLGWSRRSGERPKLKKSSKTSPKE